MLRLIGLTIKGIILLALFIGGCQFITLSDETWTSISTWATMDNLYIILGGATVIGALAVVCKVASFIGPVVGGTVKVVLLPITLPFKVLGMFSGGGGGSYSAPSAPRASAPAAPSAPKATKSVFTTPAAPTRKVEPKPQRTYEVKFIHISNPKTVHTLNCMVRANGMTEARMMVENNETSIPFSSMNEIVSMRKR